MSMINDLARDVQNHVPVQPWGPRGDSPVPLDLSFNAETGLWYVKFVKAVKGDRRIWGHANAPELLSALQAARDIQTGRRS